MTNTKPLDIAAINAILFDAGKSLDQARGALGNGDSTTALNRLSNSLAAITTAMKGIRGEDRRRVSLTENETKLLRAILKSEYHNGGMPEAERVGSENGAVWVDCLWGFEGKAKFGGVMASLTKKGLAGTDGECAWLTAEGYAAVKATEVAA